MKNKIHSRFGPWMGTEVVGAVSIKKYRDGVVLTLRGQGTMEFVNHQAGTMALLCRKLSYPELFTPMEVDEIVRKRFAENL